MPKLIKKKYFKNLLIYVQHLKLFLRYLILEADFQDKENSLDRSVFFS